MQGIIEDFSHNTKGDFFAEFTNHGENLAILNDKTQNAFKVWYNSEGHYMNLLMGDRVGIACLEYQGNQYWVYVCANYPYLRTE